MVFDCRGMQKLLHRGIMYVYPRSFKPHGVSSMDLLSIGGNYCLSSSKLFLNIIESFMDGIDFVSTVDCKTWFVEDLLYSSRENEMNHARTPDL